MAGFATKPNADQIVLTTEPNIYHMVVEYCRYNMVQNVVVRHWSLLHAA